MNIYKNPETNEILCSTDGCPEGWNKLGFDDSITNDNKKYVVGFGSGEAVFDDEQMEADSLPKVPLSITPRQARLALNHFELRETVEDAIAEADQNIKDEWEFANEIRRDWPALIQLASSVGITVSQLDDLFIYAREL